MSSPTPDPNFEASLAELERLVHELEDGQIGLEDALARYERGVGLVKRCHGLLQRAEQRIVALTDVDGAGRPVLKPFSVADDAENQGSGQHARSKRPPGPDDALFNS